MLKNLLKHSAIFATFNWFIGADATRKEFVSRYIRPTKGMKILDIGCGMGEYAGLMPEVDFTGIDISPEYIETARKHYPDAKFHLGDAASVDLPENHFDAVIMFGVFHHLTETEAATILERIAHWLKPEGRGIFSEPCYVEGQHPFARMMLNNDRGEYVRDQAGYEALMHITFPELKVDIRHDLLRIPYTHAVFEGRRVAAEHRSAA